MHDGGADGMHTNLNAPVHPDRPTALRLAALHLRSGSYELARTELEIAAGSETLDRGGLLDLAEVRWRTGDTPGAAEAAEVLVAEGEATVLAHAIAAEGAAADGRDSDAGRHVAAALALDPGTLAPLFAGIEPAPVWPAFRVAESEPPALTTTPQPPLRPTVAVGKVAERLRENVAREQAAAQAEPAAADIYTDEPIVEEPAQDQFEALDRDLGLDLDLGLGSEAGDGPAAGAIEQAVVAIREGRRADGLQLLSLALRLSPAHADEVLAAAEGVDGTDAELIRGDAHRAAGRIDEARRAYAAAAAALRR